MDKIDDKQALPNPDIPPQDMALLADAAKAVGGTLSKGQGLRRVAPGKDEWAWYGTPGIGMRDGSVRHPQVDYADACHVIAVMDLGLTFCRQEQKVTVTSGPTPHGSFQSAVSYQDVDTKQEAACRALITLLASLGRRG